MLNINLHYIFSSVNKLYSLIHKESTSFFIRIEFLFLEKKFFNAIRCEDY